MASATEDLFNDASPLTLDKAAGAAQVPVPGISASEVQLIRQRWVVIVVISLIFIALNGAVCWLIYKAMSAELRLLAQGKDIGERVITNSVFVSLVAATVVQTGLVIKGISDFLFKPNQE